MYNIVYASYNIQCSAVYFAIAMAPFTHISRFRFFHKMLINTSQFGKTKISENHKIIRKKYNKTSAKFPEITDNKPHNCAYLPCFGLLPRTKPLDRPPVPQPELPRGARTRRPPQWLRDNAWVRNQHPSPNSSQVTHR